MLTLGEGKRRLCVGYSCGPCAWRGRGLCDRRLNEHRRADEVEAGSLQTLFRKPAFRPRFGTFFLGAVWAASQVESSLALQQVEAGLRFSRMPLLSAAVGDASL